MRCVALDGSGAAAYLDAAQLVAAAREAGCDAIHPGYGFLSENAAFARLCADAGLIVRRPTPGDAGAVRRQGGRRDASRSAATCRSFRARPAPPRSTRRAHSWHRWDPAARSWSRRSPAAAGAACAWSPPRDQLAAAFERCRRKRSRRSAMATLYVERLFPRARHIEVQVLGDGTGAVSHLWERECSLQRERQKLIEIAPAPFLRPAVRRAAAARRDHAGSRRRLSERRHVRIPGRCDATTADDAAIAFIEANVRLQVEHTVTEEVTGIDLVRAQLEHRRGRERLRTCGCASRTSQLPRGIAHAGARQSGDACSRTDRPASGRRRAQRVRTALGTGRARRWLRLCRLSHQPAVRFTAGEGDRAFAGSDRFADAAAQGVTGAGGIPHRRRRDQHSRSCRRCCVIPTCWRAGPTRASSRSMSANCLPPMRRAARATSSRRPRHRARAGAKLETNDPLGVVLYGKTGAPSAAEAPDADDGDRTRRDRAAARADAGHRSSRISVGRRRRSARRAGSPGDGSDEDAARRQRQRRRHRARHHGRRRRHGVRGATRLPSSRSATNPARRRTVATGDRSRSTSAPTWPRCWIAARRALDEARPKAVARRRATGQRTARENIEDICDPGTFVEYGSLVLAARRRTAPMEELIEESPGRRPDHGPRARSTASISRRTRAARWSCRTTTR